MSGYNQAVKESPDTALSVKRNLRAIFQNSLKSIFILFLPLCTVWSCATAPHVVKETEIRVPEPSEVFVVRRGWHTGFIVPSGTIQTQLPQLRERYGDTPYLEFGWGDKVYYENDEVNSGQTVRAISWPTETVVQTQAISGRPDENSEDPGIEALCLDSEQYALLIEFIRNSFYRDSDGRIVKTKKGTTGDSQFYQGQGKYYLMNTCNNWTAKGLKTAGMDISLSFKMTAGSVMGYLSRDSGPPQAGICATDLFAYRRNSAH